MQETQKFFDPTPSERDETIVHEPDGTLSTPRFDEVEAQVARPVVPLAARPARSGGRRQWPIALVLISALAGGVVSLLAFRLYQQRQQTQEAVVTEVDGRTPTADAAEQSPEAAATQEEEQQQAQSDAPVVFEEFDPSKEGGGISDATPSRPKATIESAAATATTPARRDEARDEAREEAKPAPRAAEPKPRLVETLPAPRQVEARHEDVRRADRAEDEDFDDRRRERRRQRREQRREQRRNIDRIKDIFEGAPPS